MGGYGFWEVVLGVKYDSVAAQTYGLWGCTRTGYERYGFDVAVLATIM